MDNSTLSRLIGAVGARSAMRETRDHERIYGAPFGTVVRACIAAARWNATIDRFDELKVILDFGDRAGSLTRVTIFSVSERTTKVTIHARRGRFRLIATFD